MRSRFVRVTGSLLGLLAILLMALVPAFSHALAATEDAHDGHEQGITHCSMPSMQHQQAPHDSQIHLDACGYCSLLAHMPAIVAFPPVVAPVRPPAVRPVATRTHSVRAAEPMPGGQARAPPSLFS